MTRSQTAKLAGKRSTPVTARPPVSAAPEQSKQAELIALLRSPKGGTLHQMMALTGWQAHSVRGAISGVLRKRLGLNVLCAAVGDGARVYRIVESPAA